MAGPDRGKGGAKIRRSGAKPGKGLCDGCLWDCVQPYGTTILCPAFQPRGEGQQRQPRQGQQRFDFASPEETRTESGPDR